MSHLVRESLKLPWRPRYRGSSDAPAQLDISSAGFSATGLSADAEVTVSWPAPASGARPGSYTLYAVESSGMVVTCYERVLDMRENTYGRVSFHLPPTSVGPVKFWLRTTYNDVYGFESARYYTISDAVMVERSRGIGDPEKITAPAKLSMRGRYAVSWEKPEMTPYSRYDVTKYIVTRIEYFDDQEESFKARVVYEGPDLSCTDTASTSDVKEIVYTVQAYYSEPDLYSMPSITRRLIPVNNLPPELSGADRDYGDVFKDFTIDWTATDADGDPVTVTITAGGKTVYDQRVTRGEKHTFPVKLEDFPVGKNKISIRASDDHGGSVTRTYSFTKANTPPRFSKKNGDLGGKDKAFTFTYQVSDAEGDAVTVVEYLDDEVLRSRTNVSKDTDLYITIDAEKLRSLKLNRKYTLRVEAEDAHNGSATMTQTFTRIHLAPSVDIETPALDEKKGTVSIGFRVSSSETTKVRTSVYLDGDKKIKAYDSVEPGKHYSFKIEGMDFWKLSRGKHTIRIVAEDDLGGKGEISASFTRTADRLLVKLKTPIETDALASKISVVPNWRLADGAVCKIYACNNAFDSAPAWEDVTGSAMAGQAHTFANLKHTSSKYGVDVKIEVRRGSATTDSYVYGIGGSLE